MKKINPKIITVLVLCSAIVASAYAGIFSNSDDATQTTLNIQLDSIEYQTSDDSYGQPVPPVVTYKYYNKLRARAYSTYTTSKMVQECNKLSCQWVQESTSYCKAYDRKDQWRARYEDGVKVSGSDIRTGTYWDRQYAVEWTRWGTPTTSSCKTYYKSAMDNGVSSKSWIQR